MAQINAKSVVLFANYEDDAVPGAQVVTAGSNKLAHLHLGHNKDGALRAILGQPTTPGEVAALSISAGVDVQASREDEVAQWKFRFIQVAKTIIDLGLYAGRTAAGGSSSINFTFPPAIPSGLVDQFLLDADPAAIPYFNANPPRVTRKGPGVFWVETSMSDHPSSVGFLSGLVAAGSAALDAYVVFLDDCFQLACQGAL